MKTKVCSICKKEKDVECFWKSGSAKNGLFSSCKECNSKLKKEYYFETISNGVYRLKKISDIK